jgi:Replication-relaxation
VVRQLEPYTHQVFHEREKIIYLNKEGRELIGSKKEVKRTSYMSHTLLRNEAYLHFNCPLDWRTEHHLETEEKVVTKFEMMINGKPPVSKKKVIADAVFTRNGYLNIIEIDNTRNMSDNKKKIELYKEIMPKQQNPKLYFFTQTEERKRKLQEWAKGLKCEVMTFKEIL